MTSKFTKELERFLVWANDQGIRLGEDKKWTKDIIPDFEEPLRNKLNKFILETTHLYTVVLSDGTVLQEPYIKVLVKNFKLNLEKKSTCKKEYIVRQKVQETSQELNRNCCKRYIGFKLSHGTLQKTKESPDVQIREELVEQVLQMFNKVVTLEDIEF
ncbi:hypothetical protein EB118_02185 [bacterium]|nr:hypothetical protein [bacterium]NDC93920.1 hypothetical protein [bacterium]NDD83247.1 hypothetical protein [bacterium]NDG28897.1 hypothetical protein [bacterium]